MKRMGIVPFVCAAALVVGCNANNNKTADNNANEPAAVGTAGAADRTAVHDSERNFITKQLMDGEAEIELGKMASTKAVNPQVKRFGQMMVEDHTKAGAELKQIATKYNVDLTQQNNDDKHHDVMERLSKLQGGEFDKQYMQAMVDDHQDAVDSLEGRVDSTASLKDQITNKDKADTQVVPEQTDNAVAASVNEWAATTLPVVRHHLDQAKTINDTLDRNGRVTDTARNTTSRSSKAGSAK